MEGALWANRLHAYITLLLYTVFDTWQLHQKDIAKATASGPPSVKRSKVTINTLNKWKVENDKALNTSMWLTFEKLDRDHVALLKCNVCSRFEGKLRGCHNYSPAFVVGTSNLRVSAVKDDAGTEMHKCSMLLLNKSKASDIEYTLITRALSTLDLDSASKMKCKFEIAYILCKEGLAFTKLEALCELEEKHGTDLGTGYKNNQACATFVEYIAQSLKEGLAGVRMLMDSMNVLLEHFCMQMLLAGKISKWPPWVPREIIPWVTVIDTCIAEHIEELDCPELTMCGKHDVCL